MLPPSKGPHTSMAPPPRPSRPSIGGTINGSARPSSNTSSTLSCPGLNKGADSERTSIPPEKREKLESASGDSHHSASGGHESNVEADVLPPPVSEIPEENGMKRSSPSPSQSSAFNSTAIFDKPTSSRGRSPPAPNKRFTSVPTGGNKKIEECETKIRILEKKRLEDREKFKALEKVQTERDRFEGIIQKLQSKLQPQQQEIAELRKQIKDREARYQALEAQQAENDTVNEMATLDREMAEETAETLKLELDTLRQRHEELELEVDVLREENQELGKEMSPEETTSQGWLQMERTNERLREALMRLRDVTQQQEKDLKDQVKDLEQDLEDMNKIKNEYQQTKEELLKSDAALEDIRQQLDTALGAEEMIEELTERNMALNEKMDDLRQTIDDLESLKELNDELEINHIENEKQLQAEIDYNESLLAEEARKSAIQDGTIQDLEYTVSRFRDLAKSMQSDLEDMRASQQISETEAHELSNRSRAMMDLNMRLQVSASKAQVKAIDLELGKLEAQESSEHLSIVQLFLPETFKSEGDSVQALLRFRRIAFKASMMHTFVKERLNNAISPGQEDDIFACCDVLDKLTWISGTCQRFVHNIQTCDLEAFRRLGGAAYELEPVERALNAWVDALKRDELKGEQCATELQRSIALMTHLAEVHIPEDLEHFADEVNMRAQMMQTHLENTATALAITKSMSETKIPASDASDEEESADYEEFLRKIDNLTSQTRSAKVISSKAIRQIEDLKSRSLTLDPSTLNAIETSQQALSDLAASTRAAGTSILKIMTEEGRTAPLTYQELSRAIVDQTSFSALTGKLHSATGHLKSFYNLTSSLTQTVEFPSPPPPPPWRTLAQNMRVATADLAARDMELGRLKDEMAERNTTLAMKDKITQEMSVKVEVLEKRVGESGGRREKVRELEGEVEAARSKERNLLSKLSDLQTELQTLESEREKWKQSPQIAQPTAQPGRAATSSITSEASLRQIDTLKSEIAALQSSIRYLRSASHTHTLSTTYDFLATPIAPKPPPAPPIQTEAKDVLKEMLVLVSRPENQTVRLQPRDRADRLKWRPVRETSGWKVQRLKEEWVEWREWRDGVARRGGREKREEERRREVRKGTGGLTDRRQPLAELKIQLPEKMMGAGGQVKIVRPGEWEEMEEVLGVSAPSI